MLSDPTLALVYTDALSVFILVLELLRWPLRIVMIPIVIRRHRPSEALAWLAIVFFEPFIGLGIYAIFGRAPTSQRRIKRRRQIIESVRTPERVREMSAFAFEPDEVERYHQDLVSFAEELTRMPVARGNAVRVVTTTDQLMREMAKAIDGAEHHVHLLTYILVDDEAAHRVLEAIRRAAARGVTCRVLLDQIGSKPFLRRGGSILEHENIEIRAALPAGPIRRPFERFDVRNHRKAMVVDGRVAFVGSHNIVHPAYGTKKFGEWIDLTAVVRGPIVNQIQQLFMEDWACEGEPIEVDDRVMPTPRRVGKVPMLAVPSGPGDRHDAARQLFITMINEANDRVVMTSPYMIPDESSLLALLLAARRGVRVDVVVPARTNHPLVQLASSGYYEEMAESGVYIHLHQKGLIHAKTLSIDSHFAVLGSANFDRRSFELNYELSMFLIGQEITEKLRTHQLRYIEESVPLDLDEWRKRSRVRRFGENCAKLVGPLL